MSNESGTVHSTSVIFAFSFLSSNVEVCITVAQYNRHPNVLVLIKIRLRK